MFLYMLLLFHLATNREKTLDKIGMFMFFCYLCNDKNMIKNQ